MQATKESRAQESATHVLYICMNCHKEFVPDPGPHDRGLFCSFDCEYSYMTRQNESDFINWHGYIATRIEKELKEHEHENNKM